MSYTRNERFKQIRVSRCTTPFLDLIRIYIFSCSIHQLLDSDTCSVTHHSEECWTLIKVRGLEESCKSKSKVLMKFRSQNTEVRIRVLQFVKRIRLHGLRKSTFIHTYSCCKHLITLCTVLYCTLCNTDYWKKFFSNCHLFYLFSKCVGNWVQTGHCQIENGGLLDHGFPRSLFSMPVHTSRWFHHVFFFLMFRFSCIAPISCRCWIAFYISRYLSGCIGTLLMWQHDVLVAFAFLRFISSNSSLV